MKKLGIMGGTFNPIHMGHLLLAEWAKEAAGLDEILFIPTGHSYLKGNQDSVGGGHRLRMTELAIAGRADFMISDTEVKRAGNTYTYETLEILNREYPEREIYFIMGADCLFTIENWVHPEKIFSQCHVIAAARNGSDMEKMEQKRQELVQKFGGEITLLSFPAIEISSTDIRRRVKEQKSIRYLVPEQVAAYIEEFGLYR